MRETGQSVVRTFDRRRPRWRAWRKRLRDESGGALVELAYMLVFFGVPLLLGTAEIGNFVYSFIEVSNAAHSGAMYGMQSLTNAGNTSGIIAVAQADAPDFGTQLTVTPTTYYACSTSLGGTQYSTQSAATSACTGGTNHPLYFVKVVASATATSVIKLPGLPGTLPLSSTSVQEVEE